MFNNITPITKNLIILNVALFIATYLFQSFNIDLTALLAGYFPLSPNFHSWQIITHMFMHGGILHIAFNMFTLLSFGPVLEQVFGPKKYIILYIASGLGGFLFYNIWNFYEVIQITNFLDNQDFDIRDVYNAVDTNYAQYYPNFSNNIDVNSEAQKLWRILKTPMVGASGAIFGVIATFSVLFPNAEMVFLFIPFPIKAKFLTPIIIAISIFLGFKQIDGDNIAHFAHIGGAVIGFLYAILWRNNYTKNRFQ